MVRIRNFVPTFVLFLGFLLISESAGYGVGKTSPEKNEVVRTAYKALLTATNHSDLQRLPDQWSETPSWKVKEHLYWTLFDGLHSKDKVAIDKVDGTCQQF